MASKRRAVPGGASLVGGERRAPRTTQRLNIRRKTIRASQVVAEKEFDVRIEAPRILLGPLSQSRVNSRVKPKKHCLAPGGGILHHFHFLNCHYFRPFLVGPPDLGFLSVFPPHTILHAFRPNSDSHPEKMVNLILAPHETIWLIRSSCMHISAVARNCSTLIGGQCQSVSGVTSSIRSESTWQAYQAYKREQSL